MRRLLLALCILLGSTMPATALTLPAEIGEGERAHARAELPLLLGASGGHASSRARDKGFQGKGPKGPWLHKHKAPRAKIQRPLYEGYDPSPQPKGVPEPGPMLLLGLGLAALVVRRSTRP